MVLSRIILILFVQHKLPQDFPSSALFLKNTYFETTDQALTEKTILGRANCCQTIIPAATFELQIKEFDFMFIKISTKTGPEILISNIYTAPYSEHCQWKLIENEI